MPLWILPGELIANCFNINFEVTGFALLHCASVKSCVYSLNIGDDILSWLAVHGVGFELKVLCA